MAKLCRTCGFVMEELPLFTSVTHVCRRCEMKPKQLDSPFPKIKSDGDGAFEVMDFDELLREIDKGMKVSLRDFYSTIHEFDELWASRRCNKGQEARDTAATESKPSNNKETT